MNQDQIKKLEKIILDSVELYKGDLIKKLKIKIEELENSPMLDFDEGLARAYEKTINMIKKGKF